MFIVNWALGWVTGIAPLVLAVAYATILDFVDDLIMIAKYSKDMKITKDEQIKVDTRRSTRKWAAAKALADKLPFFTVE